MIVDEEHKKITVINRGVNPSSILKQNSEVPLDESGLEIHNNDVIYLLLEKTYPLKFHITGMAEKKRTKEKKGREEKERECAQNFDFYQN